MPSVPNTLRPVHALITPDQKAALEQLQANYERSACWIIRRAIDLLIEAEAAVLVEEDACVPS